MVRSLNLWSLATSLPSSSTQRWVWGNGQTVACNRVNNRMLWTSEPAQENMGWAFLAMPSTLKQLNSAFILSIKSYQIILSECCQPLTPTSAGAPLEIWRDTSPDGPQLHPSSIRNAKRCDATRGGAPPPPVGLSTSVVKHWQLQRRHLRSQDSRSLSNYWM